MTWEELEDNLNFALRRAEQATKDDRAFWLGFFNALEMIACNMFYEEYKVFTAKRFGLNEPIS